MRVLILGGNGMLGHQLFLHFSSLSGYEARVSLRDGKKAYEHLCLYDSSNAFYNVDVRSTDCVLSVLGQYRPTAVINAVGVLHRDPSTPPISSIEINALLPHRIAAMCRYIGARFFQISTDCVFDGVRGSYSEADLSNAVDIYGRTKYLGEVLDSHCVTLRTSIIGLEIEHKKNLIEWYLGQSGKIYGYKGAIFTGVTTMELARVIERILAEHDDLSGLWQVASEPISKYDLLSRLNAALERDDITIEPESAFKCDRSLIGSRFNERIGYRAPSWSAMIEELADAIIRRAKK